MEYTLNEKGKIKSWKNTSVPGVGIHKCASAAAGK